MARPPRQIFQRIKTGVAEITENAKKNTIKYFLVFYIFTELLSFIIEMINPQLYYEVIFYVFIQLQFFVMFLFLLRFNFCPRNKIIIYFLLVYFLSNIILPFYVNNEDYSELIRNLSIVLLSLLLSYTLFNSNVPKNEIK